MRILIIEDEISLRKSLKKLLELKKYQVDEAEDFKSAEKKITGQDYAIFLLDLRLPDKNGINLLEKYPKKMSGKTIIITAHATIPSAVKAIQTGAYNYLEKPLDEELLFVLMEQILEMNRLKARNISLKRELIANQPSDKIISKSKQMAKIVSQARKFSKTDAIILIQGETGVGKEIIAHFIHKSSLRKENIFLPINCSSVPEHIFESELFGHKKGAFTDAIRDYAGRFIQANKGTLFLDEIGEMPYSLQAKLLRVLDDKIIYQLGNKDALEVDIRLIAASNKDLWQEVTANRFRKDLYFRLRESIIIIPPLRERTADILPLFHHYVAIYNEIFEKKIKRITKDAEDFLKGYLWEGNVRELKNTVKNIFILKEDSIINKTDIQKSLNIKEYSRREKFLPLKEVELNYIKQVLKYNQNNIKRTAEILGISRSRLYRKIEGSKSSQKTNKR